MSTYYYIYAEANVKGKWYSLNPVMPLSSGGYGTGAITYFSQSSYPEIIYHLKGHSIYSGLPEDISNSTKEHFRDNMDDLVDYWTSSMTYREYYKSTAFVVNFDAAVLQKIKKDRPYKYMGYIPREILAAFECGELEEIECWITPQEYKELDPEEQRIYVYHEWNNWADDYTMYQDISKKICAQMDWFSQIDGILDEECTYADRDLTPGQVRLIVYKC